MAKRLVLIFVFCSAISLAAIAQVPFENDFEDKAMRLDVYHIGDAKEEIITIDRICQEGIWPESRTHLIVPFNTGRYAVKV